MSAERCTQCGTPPRGEAAYCAVCGARLSVKVREGPPKVARDQGQSERNQKRWSRPVLVAAAVVAAATVGAVLAVARSGGGTRASPRSSTSRSRTETSASTGQRKSDSIVRGLLAIGTDNGLKVVKAGAVFATVDAGNSIVGMALSPSGRRLAFVSVSRAQLSAGSQAGATGTSSSIKILEPGGNITVVATDLAQAGGNVWWASSNRLVLISGTNDDHVPVAVDLARPLPSHELATGRSMAFEPSRAGRWALRIRTADRIPTWVDLGSGRETDAGDPVGDASGYRIAWSPNGSRVAIADGNRLLVGSPGDGIKLVATASVGPYDTPFWVDEKRIVLNEGAGSYGLSNPVQPLPRERMPVVVIDAATGARREIGYGYLEAATKAHAVVVGPQSALLAGQLSVIDIDRRSRREVADSEGFLWSLYDVAGADVFLQMDPGEDPQYGVRVLDTVAATIGGEVVIDHVFKVSRAPAIPNTPG